MLSRIPSAVLAVLLLLLLTGCEALQQLASQQAPPASTADAGSLASKERILYYQLSGQVDQGWALTEQENFQRVEKLVIVSSTILGFKHQLHFDKLELFETKHLKEKGWHLISFEQGLGVPEVNGAVPKTESESVSPDSSATAPPVQGAAPGKLPAGGKSAAVSGRRTPTKRGAAAPNAGDEGQVSREPSDKRVSLLTIKLEWLDFNSQHHKVSVQVAKPSENPPSRDSVDRLFSQYLETALVLEQQRKAEAKAKAKAKAEKLKRAKGKKGKRKKKRSKGKKGKRKKKRTKEE